MFKSVLVSAFSIVLLMSLMCSLSVQPLHADLPVAETADQVNPLRTGQRAPGFVVKDVAGDAFAFDPNALQRPVVIVTFRGGWCPYCNMHLSELHTVVPEIAAMGVDVLFLSGDRPETLFRFC